MNRCHVIKKLSAYIDNQLSEKDKSFVEEHLKACRTCSRELDRLKLVSEKLKAWHVSGPEASFDNSVRNKIVALELERGGAQMKKKTLAILIPSGALAGILMLLFFGQLFLSKDVHTVSREYLTPALKSSAPGSFMQERRAGNMNALYVGKPAGVMAEGDTETSSISKGDYYEKKAISAEPAYNYTAEGPVIVIQPNLPATGQGEKIIRTGVIQLEVSEAKVAYKKASEICEELGGYMSASRFYKDREGREAGSITMRIPKDKFTIALDRLGALGKVEDINTDSRDVSQEYSNLKAELDAAMVVYNKMVEALQKRQVTIPEAMRLESELTPVLRRISDLKNKIEYLNNMISFTTITVNFHESRISTKTLGETKELFKQNLLKAGISIVKFLAVAIYFAVIGLVVIVVGAVLLFAVIYLIKLIIKKIR